MEIFVKKGKSLLYVSVAKIVIIYGNNLILEEKRLEFFVFCFFNYSNENVCN